MDKTAFVFKNESMSQAVKFRQEKKKSTDCHVKIKLQFGLIVDYLFVFYQEMVHHNNRKEKRSMI